MAVNDEPRDPNGGLFELGRLHGRVSSLENRVDKQEAVLAGIDKKVDEVLIALAQAVGGRDKMRTLIKYGFATLAAIGSCAGIAIGFLKYVLATH